MMDKRRMIFLVVAILLSAPGICQKYATEKTYVSFFSDAAIEDIKADNAKSSSIFNAASGEIAFSVPIKEFEFAKSLMKEHFNEKYMETEKHPRSTFEGKITGFDLSKNGTQQVKASGELLIHGVKKNIKVPGTIEKQGDKLVMKSKFIVKLEDYKIKIPQLLWQNIAEEVEVTVDFTFKPQ